MAGEDDRGFHLASAYVSVSLDEDELDADIAELDSKLAGIRGKAIGLGIDQATVDASIADIQAKLAALGAEDVQIRVGLAGGPETVAEIGSLAAVMKTLQENSGPLLAAMTGLASTIKPVGDESEDAAVSVRVVGSALGQLGQQASSAHGWMGLLTRDITLWGGALGDVHMVGMIPLWHILLDGILETTIAFTEATVALVAFGLAAAPAVEDIVTHVKSVDDVVKTFGIDIPPVTGHLRDLGQALAPQVVELYGGALNTLSSAASPLAGIVGRIATGFDDWMAKLDLFMDKQSHADGLIAAGGDVLQQMSVILDNLGVSLENLVKADPGTVHFLGDLLEGASKLIEVFTELPTPLLYSVLAIHSFMLWGGLLGTAASKLLVPIRALSVGLGGLEQSATAVGQLGEEAGGLDKLKAVLADIGDGFSNLAPNMSKVLFGSEAVGTALTATGADLTALGPEIAALGTEFEALGADIAAMGTEVAATGAEIAAAGAESGGFLATMGALAANPLTWVVGAAAGVAVLAFAFRNAQDATGQWITTLNQGLSNDTWFNTLPQNMQAITAVSKQLTTQQHQLSQSMTASQGAVSGVATRYGAYSATAQEAAISTGRLTQSTGELHAEQQQLTTTQKAQVAFLGSLGKSYDVNLTQSMALATLAGVHLSQVTKEGSKAYQEAVQQVANLVTGYKNMSVTGGILSNSVNAVTFASEQQSSKIEQLTQGWTAFISMVTGGMSSFSTFETQVAGLGPAATDTATISVSAGKASIKSAAATSSAYSSSAMSASSANSAITTYTGSLIKGSKAQQEAANYQEKLTADLQTGGDTAAQAQAAMDAYTDSVTANGVGSAAQASARAKLLDDLEKTGTVATQAANAASKTTASLDGLSPASLQLQQTWVGAITDGNAMMNSLMEMASAAGLGAKGTQLLTQAGKDMVSQMLPMAQGSADATAQLYALAQQAGYQGPDAFGSLVTWVGKTSDAAQNLQEIEARLGVASASLGTDVTNLANAIGQDLTAAMAQAVTQAGGGKAALDQFSDMAITTHDNIHKMGSSVLQVAEYFLNMTGNTTEAKQEFEALATQLGFSTTKANEMWQAVLKVAEAESRIPAHVSSVIQITEEITGGGTATGGGGGMRITPHASGGQVRSGSTRPGADDNVSLLSRDEWVIQAPAVHKYGSQLFDDLNSMRYAGGGQVGAGAYYTGPPASPAAADRAPITVIQNYNGPQHPTPEMSHAMMLNLTSAISMAG